MTKTTSPDLLDLAEGVADGRLSGDEAERQVRGALGPDHDDASEKAVRELRQLIAAARAVRSHVSATREAWSPPMPDLAHSTASITAVVPGPVRAGVTRRRSSSGGDRRAPQRMWLLVAAMLALGAGAVGASLVGGNRAGPNPQPTLHVAVANPTAGPTSVTATSAPSPTANGLPAVAGQFDTVCDFGLASGTVGWVSTTVALYRTADAGATWSIVSPQGWPAATSNTSFFADAVTAYSFLAGSPARIAATHDGGATWVLADVQAGASTAAPAFSFQTATSGSVVLYGALKSDPVSIYSTTDGGMTWTGPRSGVGAIGSPGCGHQGLTQLLALTNAKYDNKPFDNLLQLSSDGGATWVNRQLPVSTISPKNSLKWVEGLWSDGSGRVVMLLSVEGAEQLYSSGDDGRTWQLLRTFGRPAHGYLLPEFLSATAWVFVAEDASVVFSTMDGGASWRTTAGSAFKVRSATFGSPDLGWASVYCGGLSYTPDNPVCATSAKGTILVTTNGGQTWAPIGQ
jgi:photosystem II stability/assembly factor-like uncharacterized protein